MKDVLIIGGGPAGLGAADALLQLGTSVLLLDMSPFAGGIPIEMACKGEYECTRCHVCLSRDTADGIRTNRNLVVRSLSRIKSVQFGEEGIKIEFQISPRYIDLEECINCGRCVEVCPHAGALIPPPYGALPEAPYINRDFCAHFTSKDCDLCVQVCPCNAIKFGERPKKATQTVGSVVIAAGLEPVDPSGALHYGYGIFPNVVTSLEAERIVSTYGELRRPSDGKKPSKVAIIQCAGSRTSKGGVEYCSKFCCKYGLRIARALHERDPEMLVEFIFMDLRTFEPRVEAINWAQGKKNIKLSQGVPGFILSDAEGNLTVRKVSAFDESIEEIDMDMVLLSIGGRPRPETKLLAEHFSLQLDDLGFISNDNRDKNVFVAGSCKEPMDIEESYAEGRAAAISVLRNQGAGQ